MLLYTVDLEMSILIQRLLKGEEPVRPRIHTREQERGDLEVSHQLWRELLAFGEGIVLHQPAEQLVLAKWLLNGCEYRYCSFGDLES